ncbi:MAG TPA: MFS transporter [Verrucomicrobiales bacterium]|nr:MFS transporter [Verrucomicrobiales bacterium]
MTNPDTSLPTEAGLVAGAVRRARGRLIPFLLLMYVLSYLDRANIGYAKQAFQAATGVSNAAFALGAGAFFLTYALCEIPSNLVLHRVGARRWMARIMIVWGLVAAAMVFARTDTRFTVFRLVLGAAEAGFFPGSILFLTYWFPERDRGEVMARFYFGSPLAMMLGGPISGLLLDLDGVLGLQGWQLMFAVEGLAAAVVGIWAYFYLTDRPRDAAWMPLAEREALGRALAREEGLKVGRGAVTFGEVFRSPRLLHFASVYFLIQICGYGVAFYLPTQVSALVGEKVGLRVGLLSAIPWGVAILAASFLPRWAIRSGRRRTFACLSLAAAAVGLALSAVLPPAAAIAALCLVTAGIISAQPVFWTFPTDYLGGVGAAAGIAAINAIGNLGGLVAPSVKTALEERFHSQVAGLLFLAVAGLCAALLVSVIRRDPPGASR